MYSKNGGALIEIATYYDDMPNDTIIGGDINSLIGNPGDTIKLFMHVRNNSNNEQFEWEEIKLTGIELEKNSNNNFDVVNLEFMGPGEKKGMDFYDEVTKLEINSLDRPPKELVYIFGLIILGLVLFNQRRRL